MKSFQQFLLEKQGVLPGIASRYQLPQIDNDKHEDFEKFLNTKGIRVKDKVLPAGELKPTQNHYNPEKVESLKKCIKGSDGKCLKKWKFWTSHDHRILDGHHRYCATPPDHPVACKVADCSYGELVSAGHDFNDSQPSEQGSSDGGNTGGDAGGSSE